MWLKFEEMKENTKMTKAIFGHLKNGGQMTDVVFIDFDVRGEDFKKFSQKILSAVCHTTYNIQIS